LSQYARDVPPGVFSAPRARGLPLLVAPVTLVTTSVPAIRAYLTVLSGVGLFCAFWPWLRVRPGAVVPGAAALFASVWVAVFYGNEAMPDMFVAYGAIAAVGLFALAVRPGRQRWAAVGLAGAVACTALVRPTDALWVAVSLVVAALVVRAWRRPGLVLAVLGGVAIGWGEWVGEAYAYYGGPLARLSAAGAENETGLHFSLYQHLAALSETQILCRPACHQVSPVVSVWFFAVPVVAVVGCVVTRRTSRFAPMTLAAVVAAVFVASYIVGVGYAAPRFLLPGYGLAALPAAEAVRWLVRGAPARLRPATVGLAVVGVLAHLGVQARGLDDVLHRQAPPRAVVADVGAGLARLGTRPPCLVYGHDAPQVAFYAHCHESAVKQNWGGGHTPAGIRAARAAGQQVVVLTRQSDRPAHWLDRWRRVPLTDAGAHRWYAYLPPAPRRR
ncbi:MAG: hypothetical protein J2P24_14880, partial [Streptosporangiales bacterium]|nr:hypothetical protein [Streptosporangiales bacterium]